MLLQKKKDVTLWLSKTWSISMIDPEYKHTIEKRTEDLGEGEWNGEGDFFKYEDRGITCYIYRVIADIGEGIFGGHLCGYVELPADFCGDIESLEVHGGITFDEVEEGVRVIGFDCAHAFDLVPSIDKSSMFKLENFVTYKNIDYVKEVLTALVDQVLEACDGKKEKV